MSLGLNDLKKSARTSAKQTADNKMSAPTDGGAGAVSENWARTTKIARPWTTQELKKEPTRRKSETAVNNAAMNSDWADDHISPVQVFDMEIQNPMMQLLDLSIELKSQAVEIERKIKRAAKSPFKILRSFLAYVQK